MGWFKRSGKPKKESVDTSGPTLKPDGSLEVPDDLESAVDLDLTGLGERLELILPHVLEQQVDRPLLQARLADACRDAGKQPIPPEKFVAATDMLDEEGWRRLALLVDMLDASELREGIGLLLLDSRFDGATTLTDEAFIRFARDTSLLNVTTLRTSELRREEFLRRWLLRLGAGVSGETVAASLQRLARLDYGNLLGEAERARLIAEERMAYLKKLQDAEDAARRPRGKW